MNTVLEVQETNQPLRVRRGAQVELRLGLRELKGHIFVDLRQFFCTDDGEWLPSRKGFTVPPALWVDFVEAVVELDRRLRADGLLDDGEAGDGADIG